MAQLHTYLYLYITIVFTHISIVNILHNTPLYSTLIRLKKPIEEIKRWGEG
jgi:cell division protein FtsL